MAMFAVPLLDSVDKYWISVWVTEDKAASPGIWTVNRNKLAGHSQGLAWQEICSTLSSLGTPVYMPATILIASLSRCHVKQYLSLLEGIWHLSKPTHFEDGEVAAGDVCSGVRATRLERTP